MFCSVHVREPGEESSRVHMDNRRIHSVERDDRGKCLAYVDNGLMSA